MLYFSLGVIILVLFLVHGIEAVDDDVVDHMLVMADFESYVTSSPEHCYVCKNSLHSFINARHSNVFTCNHGQHMHIDCVDRFFTSAEADKRCPHSNCQHAPLIHPGLSTSWRFRFYHAYRLLQSQVPGKCTQCRRPLFPNGINVLRMGTSVFKQCATGRHVFHPSCTAATHECQCGNPLENRQVSLERLMAAPVLEQFDRLKLYYQSLFEESGNLHNQRFGRNFPGTWRAMQHDIPMPPIQVVDVNTYAIVPNTAGQSSPRQVLLQSSLSPREEQSLQAKSTFEKALEKIKKVDTEHKGEPGLTECSICAHAIVGENEPASVKYLEELNDGENPVDHMQNIHLACLQYELSLRPRCPLCRRSILQFAV